MGGGGEPPSTPMQNVLEQSFKEAIKVKEAGRSPSFVQYTPWNE